MRGRYHYVSTSSKQALEDLNTDRTPPLIGAILEYAGEGLHTAHTTTDSRTDLVRVDVLVQLVRIGGTGHVEGLRCANESPEGRPIGLSNDVGGVP